MHESREISGIYCIRNTKTDEYYVGSSIRLFERLKDHMTFLAIGMHINKIMQISWNNHGPSNFEFACLEIVPDPQNLESRELFWIKKKKAHIYGFNTKTDLFQTRGMIQVDVDIKKDLEDMNLGSMHQTLQQLIRFYRKNHTEKKEE